MTRIDRLSNSDSRTIRHAREAVSLIMQGAMQRLDTQFGPNDSSNRSHAIDELILHLREELEGFPTSEELGIELEQSTATEQTTELLSHLRPDMIDQLLDMDIGPALREELTELREGLG